MADSSKSGIRPGKGPWEAIGGITAVAGVVVAVVFGVMELTKPDTESQVLPADERLELVDVEFAAEPVDVAVLEELGPGGQPKESPGPGKKGIDTEPHFPLVITLRNPADDPAVLTGVKVVVHEVIDAPPCGSAFGGDVQISANYDFWFPIDLDGAWSKVNPQNFAVEPHAVDALSITIGPDLADAIISSVWRFSVYGVSKGGREAHWGDGIGTTHPRADIAKNIEYVKAGFPRNRTEAEIRECAGENAGHLSRLVDAAGSGATKDPALDALQEAYRTVAAG